MSNTFPLFYSTKPRSEVWLISKLAYGVLKKGPLCSLDKNDTEIKKNNINGESNTMFTETLVSPYISTSQNPRAVY